MESNAAILALAALAQPTRLTAFRRLVAREPEGLAAGVLAAELAVPANTMSAHLATLARAGLVRGGRRGRAIVYRADLSRLGDLLCFLLKDCCGGRPDVCAPLLNDLNPCRAKETTA
jgi:ArsR family transcriptional regulator